MMNASLRFGLGSIVVLGLASLAACHAYVNERLREMAEAGFAPYQICYFKTGDRYLWYEDFPTSLSMETVRTALLKMGARPNRGRVR